MRVGSIEDAGYNINNYSEWVGVYAGTSDSSYFIHNLVNILKHNTKKRVNIFMHLRLNSKDFLTTKVSYKLNLKGPR